MDFYELIKQLRIEKGMSQDQLAKLTGYTDRSSIAKVESGKVKLNPEKLRLFEQALGCKPGELRMCSDEYDYALTHQELIEVFEDAEIEELIEIYKRLNGIGQKRVLSYANDLLASGLYNKDDK